MTFLIRSFLQQIQPAIHLLARSHIKLSQAALSSLMRGRASRVLGAYGPGMVRGVRRETEQNGQAPGAPRSSAELRERKPVRKNMIHLNQGRVKRIWPLSCAYCTDAPSSLIVELIPMPFRSLWCQSIAKLEKFGKSTSSGSSESTASQFILFIRVQHRQQLRFCLTSCNYTFVLFAEFVFEVILISCFLSVHSTQKSARSQD